MAISKANKGRKMPEHTKYALLKVHAGSIASDELKQKLRDAWKKRRLTPMSEETKLKISKAAMGNQRRKGKKKMSTINDDEKARFTTTLTHLQNENYEVY